MSTPFWSGKDSRLVVFFGDEQVIFDIISWSVKRVGVKAADPICGEDRDRMQFITNNFDVNIEAKQQKLDALKALMEDQDNDDARALPTEKSVGFLILPNDGTQAGFQAEKFTVDDWELAIASRTDRNALTVPGRCQYFKPLPTL